MRVVVVRTSSVDPRVLTTNRRSHTRIRKCNSVKGLIKFVESSTCSLEVFECGRTITLCLKIHARNGEKR